MKRIIVGILALISTTGAFAQFSGQGNGTERDPYLVSNADELFEVRNDLNAYYKQVCDIDLTEWIMEDSPRLGWSPIGNFNAPFSGVYDGDNHKIMGLYISRDNIDNVGLFGCVNQSEIKNVNIVNARILGKDNVGILVGLAKFCNDHSKHDYDNKISNIVIVGSQLEGTNNVGGLVGNVSHINRNVGGNNTLRNTIIEGNYVDSQIKANNQVGGICGNVVSGRYHYYYSNYTYSWGDTYKTNILNNMFSGDICGKGNVGGIVGYSQGETWYESYSYYLYPNFDFENNVSSGNVRGTGSVCGILGGYYFGSNDDKAKNNISKILSHNFAICDTISGTSNVYRITREQYPNNYAYNGTVAIIDNKPSYFEDDESNGMGYGMKNLKKKTTYEGASFDMNNRWSIIDGESLPFMKSQSKPAKVTSFYAGSKSIISGTAEGVGKVYVLKGNILYSTDIVDGEWSVNIGNIQANSIVNVYCASDGLMTSIPTQAIAEASPIVGPDVILGDSNSDGVVDAADVVGTINYILGKPSSSFNQQNADVNEDGQILVDDAVGTVNVIMNNQ